MYFIAFIAALLIFIAICIFPIAIKIRFKIQYFKGFCFGICCVILCIIAFIACFYFVNHLKGNFLKENHIDKNKKFYTFTFYEWFEIQESNLYEQVDFSSLSFICLGSYFIFDLVVFFLLLFFIIKLKNSIESKNQIFMFISGFSIGFELPFGLSMLISLEMIGNGDYYEEQNKFNEYNQLLLSFEYFVFSYLSQLIGVILLLFAFVYKHKCECLLLAFLSVFLPFMLLAFSLIFQSRIMIDFITELTYYAALVLGIKFYRIDNYDIPQEAKLLSSFSQN